MRGRVDNTNARLAGTVVLCVGIVIARVATVDYQTPLCPILFIEPVRI